MSNSLSLDIGGVTFHVTLPAPDWRPALRARYASFLHPVAPKWRVRLMHEPSLCDTDAPWIEHDGAVTRFRVSAYAGWMDLARRRAAVSAPAPERAASALERTLAYICMQVLPREHDALLLHAAGVVLDGAGHIFCGASGTGKTTLAQLVAGRGQVLTDETVIVRLKAAGAELLSTPFWGHSTPRGLVRRVNQRVPVRAVYVLVPAPAFNLTRLGPGPAVMALLGTEKVATERVASASAWLNVVERLIAQVPVYRLAFQPTTELWDFLAEVKRE